MRSPPTSNGSKRLCRRPLLASGRRIPRTGGVILAKCDSRETLQARLSQDPFQQLGLARTEIIPFEASMASPALQSLL